MTRLGITAVLGRGVVTEAGGRSLGTAVVFSHHAELLHEQGLDSQLASRAKGARIRIRGAELPA